MKNIVLIAAVSDNGVIGKDNRLPWDIPEDLRRFRSLVRNYPVIMGRRTHESIGKPVDCRLNVVLSKNRVEIEDVDVACSIEDAVEKCSSSEKIYVIGGQSIYEQFLPLATLLEITWIHRDVEGDAFFPAIDPENWKEVKRTDSKEYSFVTYARQDAEVAGHF